LARGGGTVKGGTSDSGSRLAGGRSEAESQRCCDRHPRDGGGHHYGGFVTIPTVDLALGFGGESFAKP
jgi:hypothetical protein